MYNATEQFSEVNKTGVAQASKFAAIALANTEKLFKLNFEATKSAFAQGVAGASEAATVKDVQALIALRSKYAENGVQTAMSYSRTLYELASEAQSQYSQIAEEAWSAYSKGVAAWVDKASASAPAGSDVAVNAFRSTMAATAAAVDQFQKASKQVANFADASVRAAADNASKVVGSTKGRKAA